MLFQGSSVGATSEVGKAKEKLVERGQKLNEIEDRTELMANEAKVCTVPIIKIILEAQTFF